MKNAETIYPLYSKPFRIVPVFLMEVLLIQLI